MMIKLGRGSRMVIVRAAGFVSVISTACHTVFT
jgi:hypothetical protein